jgi:hypothetical protein
VDEGWGVMSSLEEESNSSMKTAKTSAFEDKG